MNLILERIGQAVMKGRSVVDGGDIGLIVEYIGSEASGKVAVDAATGDIAFTHGAVGAEAADTTIGAPTLNGTIDVSDASANTFGEVVDLINQSANWRAYLVDVLRSDTSVNTLATKSATQAKVSGGITLLKDTAVTLNLSLAIKLAISTASTDAVKSSGVVSFAKELGKWSEVLRIVSNNTYGSGTSLIQVFAVNRLTGASVKVYERAGGATTVEQDLNVSDGFGRGIASNPDEYLLVRMVGSAACTGFLTVAGKTI